MLPLCVGDEGALATSRLLSGRWLLLERESLSKRLLSSSL